MAGCGFMSNDTGDRVRLTVAEAYSLATGAMESVGFDVAESAVIADHVIDAALCGYEYSGLPKLLNLIDHPNFSAPRRPMKIVSDSGPILHIDGGNQVGMVGMHAATKALIERANIHNFAMVGVRNMWMSGRSAYYVEMAARAGLVGIHLVAAPPTVAPFGGASAALGTNPLAFGFPAEPDPLLIDLGTAAFMGTDLHVRARSGTPLPKGSALDRFGRPTTDAAEARLGALLPFGGHKGYALGLALHALGQLLVGEPGSTSYLFIAFKPSLFTDGHYSALLSVELDRIRSTPLQEGFDAIRIPGERSLLERSRRQQEGVEIDRPTYVALRKIAQCDGAD